MTTSNRLAAFVTGAGHSGSTLLGLTLGAHPDVFYAGEARKSLFLGDETKPLKKRVCKLCGLDCAVWGDLRPREHPEADLYELLSARTGRPVVLDSTKKADWILDAAHRVRARGAEARLLFLQRDGRAVVNSRLRKYPEISATQHARDWRLQMEASAALARAFGGEREPAVLELRYESLATNPEAELTRAAGFLGLSFDPRMLTPWTSEQHPLGGNSGTQWVMARETARDGSLVDLSDRTRAYYESHPRAFVLDTRWRIELAPEALAAFLAEAGEQNEPYQWDEQGIG